MKILIRDEQQAAFKELVEVLKFLAKIDSAEATDAIISAYKIAEILGVERDLNRITKAKDEEEDYDNWTDMFCLRIVLRHVIHKYRCSKRRCGEMR